MRTAKTLIRLGGCPGWSESLLGAQVITLVLSCSGSNNNKIVNPYPYNVSRILTKFWQTPGCFELLGLQTKIIQAKMFSLQHTQFKRQNLYNTIRGVAEQRSSPELCLTNKTKMHLKQKNELRITRVWGCSKFSKSVTFTSRLMRVWGLCSIKF